MDPQQRLLLETSMSGLVDAGLSKTDLMGSEAGGPSYIIPYYIIPYYIV